MSIKTGLLPVYPATFPAPKVSGYTGDIDSAVDRSVGLFADQSRTFETSPTSLSMQFLMTLDLFGQWSHWIDQNAVENYILMDCVDQYDWPVPGGKPPLDSQLVRMSSGYSISPVGSSYVEVKAVVQVIPRDIGTAVSGIGSEVVPPINLADDWIVARQPYDPSPWGVVANKPATVPTNIVAAEKPHDHI